MLKHHKEGAENSRAEGPAGLQSDPRKGRSAGHPRQAGKAADPDAPFIVSSDGRVGEPGPEGPGPRVQRLERLLFEELDRLFRLEVSDPRLSDIAIARVLLSPDLRNAKIYYARRESPPSRAPKLTPGAARVQAEAQQRGVTEALTRVTPFLRARLAQVVLVKRLPDLHFHRDRDAEAALRASLLIVTPSVPSQT